LTEAEAAARMLELVSTHDAEQRLLEANADERRRRGMTFRELTSEWMTYLEHEKGLKPSTLRDYGWLLAEPGQAHRRGQGTAPGLLMGVFGDTPVKDVTPRMVAEYLRSLDRAGAGPRTVNKHRGVISAAFNFGMREDTYRLPVNPAARTNKRREFPPAVLDFYETDEVELIARAAAAGAHRRVARLVLNDAEIAARVDEDARDGELIRIAAFTGLRVNELLALRWADVNLADRRLVVHRAFSNRIEGPTKSWQARYIPIADPAAAAFARLSRRRDFLEADDFVFCSRFGQSLDDSALRRRFKAAVAATGLRALKLHALRHGAGSMIARQADPRWVQSFLGHSQLTTTERYLHAKSRPEDVDLLNRAFVTRPQVLSISPEQLAVWDRAVNDDPVPNLDPNHNVIAGSGRPATRDELIALVSENNARIADERSRG
jgi:integrase